MINVRALSKNETIRRTATRLVRSVQIDLGLGPLLRGGRFQLVVAPRFLSSERPIRVTGSIS